MYAELYLNTLKHLPYVMVKNGEVAEISSALVDFTGYSKDDLLQKNIRSVWHKLFKNKLDISSLETQQAEQGFFLFTKYHHVRQVNILVHQGLSRDENIYIFLEKPNSRFEDKCPLLQQIHLDNLTGIAVYSVHDSILLKANQQYLNSLPEPYNKIENVIGLRVDEFLDEWDESEIKSIWLNVIKTGKSFSMTDYEYSYSSSKKAYWDLMLVPIIECEEVKYIVVIKSEVTGRIQYEQLLKEQRNHLFKIIDTFDLPIVRLSYPDLSIIEINQKAKQHIRGMENREMSFEEEIKPGENIRKLSSVFNSEENMKCIREMECAKKIVYHNNFQTMHYDRRICYKAIYQPILNVQEEIVEVIIVVLDITHEVEEKEMAEKTLKTKDEFFAFITHEFKTPLTVINAAVQAMEALCKNELSEKSKGFINKIRQNVFRQLRLVNNILDMTRAEAGHFKLQKRNMDVVAITRAISDSVLLYARQKGVEVVFSSLIEKKIIAVDDEKYERILLNLLSNAIKFTPKGGKIFVNISMRKRNICIEIKDEGVGIPKEKQNIIFDRFGQVDSSLTRKSEGTGIGLNLVRMLVNTLGGKITVDSEEGKGSTFALLLPCKKVSEPAEEQLKLVTNDRLIQMAAIEFSDIYLS